MGAILSRPLNPEEELPSYYGAGVTDFPSRGHVSIVSWVTIFLGFMSLLSGRVLSILEIALGVAGAYASWTDSNERVMFILLFTMGNVFRAAIEGSFFLLLLCAKSDALSKVVVGIFSTQTFPAFGEELAKLLTVLKVNGGAILIFSMITKLIIEVFAIVWGSQLYTEAVAYNAGFERAPLIGHPSQSSPSTLPRYSSGAGSLGNVSGFSSHPSPRGTHPFQGRGYRLGE